MKKLLLFIGLCSFSIGAYAQENTVYTIEMDMNSCVDDSSNFEDYLMLECIYNAYQRYETVIDTCYSNLLKTYPEAQAELLRVSQDKWEAFKDAQFSFFQEHYGAYSGRMYRIVTARERVEVLKERALFLAQLDKVQRREID